MTSQIRMIGRERNPFVRRGVEIAADGTAHYTDLPASLLAMLQGHVQRMPDAEAVVELGGERLSYRQLWDRCAEMAGGLRASGLKHGERVAITHPAGVQWVLAYWAVMMAGGISVAVNTRLTAEEVAYVRQDAGVVRELGPDHECPKGAPYLAPDVSATSVVTIFYTSGTTGNAKGVPFTHENLLTSSRNIIDALRISAPSASDIRTLISVPPFHVTGCNTQMMEVAFLGGTAVIMPQFDREKFVSAIVEEGINFIITVPTIYALVLRMPQFQAIDRTRVRWVAYGGAPIAPTLVRELKQALPTPGWPMVLA